MPAGCVEKDSNEPNELRFRFAPAAGGVPGCPTPAPQNVVGTLRDAADEDVYTLFPGGGDCHTLDLAASGATGLGAKKCVLLPKSDITCVTGTVGADQELGGTTWGSCCGAGSFQVKNSGISTPVLTVSELPDATKCVDYTVTYTFSP